ncbi:hypothetical protein P7K49_038069 [Saguinus oedipus]|uniref:KRAB-related domain-containing protein n=1 Tax=Saguinus oedipus TaxID=9490 RepID=A0ABQ9TDL4_SAGOE|nr:hypothetical protein P7K49_038069 [Saguinus oedipus]
MDGEMQHLTPGDCGRPSVISPSTGPLTQDVSLAGQTAPRAMNGDDSSAKNPSDDEQISENKLKALDDIAQYFSEKDWEKLKYSEKITYMYMKRNYEAMCRLGFQVTIPLFMRDKAAGDSQEDDSDRDSNSRNLVECRTMTFGMFQGLLPQIMPRKPPEEEENDSEAVPETSGTQNDVKELCYPQCTPMYSGEPSTLEMINEIPGKRK